jgi:hypothetical protein
VEEVTKKKNKYDRFALSMDGGGFNFSMDETYTDIDFIDMKIHFPIKSEHLVEFMDFIVHMKSDVKYVLQLRREDDKKPS